VSEIKKVGLAGYGYWGRKLAGVLRRLGVLWAIADSNESRILEAQEQIVELGNYATDINGMVALGCDSIVIATPPETHYSLAAEALARNLHVFVEKPLATVFGQAKQLENLAKEKNLSLKVGHIYLHNPGLMAIPRPIGRAELYVKLLNEGGPPSESTRELVWAALPHAVSIALHFFPDQPYHVVVFERESTRLKVRLDYFDGSTAYLDVGDHTGVRMRGVELRVGNLQYQFSADRPHRHVELFTQETWTAQSDKDPLTLEIEDFLKGEGVDTMGSKVVELIKKVRAGGSW